MPVNSHPILETQEVSKSFGKVHAAREISIQLHEGEIICILGENGAGKSTLMNILYGLYRPDSGRILLYGKEVSFASPRDAINSGLGMVHQHFMLVETLSATQNIILGQEPLKHIGIDYSTARTTIQNLSNQYGLDIDPDSLVGDMSVGLQQRVEILKALYRNARILILDEPTAVLTPQEIEHFFSVVQNLRDQGVSVIIITHKLDEIKAISERVYILRKGQMTGEFVTKDVSAEEMARHMVGRDVVLQFKKTDHQARDEKCFQIKNLKVSSNQGVPVVRGMDLTVRPGEIVGIAGVGGNGQDELAEALIGTRPVQSGTIKLNGTTINSWSVMRRITKGMGYVPANRQKDGLVLPFSIAENILLGNQYKEKFVRYAHIRESAVTDKAVSLIDRFQIAADGPGLNAGKLSGGNQQKVILARELDRNPQFLLICQPTRGLDVGAIEYIHKQLIAMRDNDIGILLISLELEEIFSLSDRIVVMYKGQIQKEFDRSEATHTEVGYYMTGGVVS